MEKKSKRHELRTLYNAGEGKNRTEYPKLGPGARILPDKFQLEGPYILISNNGLLTKHFLFYFINLILLINFFL